MSLINFNRFHNEVLNMPRESFQFSLKKIKCLAEHLCLIKDEFSTNGLTIVDIYVNIHKKLLHTRVPTRISSFESLFNLSLTSTTEIKRHYLNVAGRDFRHWIGLASLLELLDNIGSKKIITNFSLELKNANFGSLKVLTRDKILNINTKDNPYIQKLQSGSYYRNLDFRPGVAIIKYLKKIRRPATKFELSIFCGRPNNTLPSEEAIISQAVDVGRRLGRNQNHQIREFFIRQGWVDRNNNLYSYIPSQEPYFKFNSFFILMEAVNLINVNRNLVTLTPLSNSLFSHTEIIESREIEQLYNDIEDQQQEDEIESLLNNRLARVQNAINLDPSFETRVNTRASRLSGRSASVTHRVRRRNQLIALISKIKANFICESCSNPTFQDESGNYHVVSHHIVEYNDRENGPDVLENLVVLCPNCHAKAHFAKKETICRFYGHLRASGKINMNQFEKLRRENILRNGHIKILESKGVISNAEANNLLSI